MTTPNNTFLTFSNTYLTGSQTVQRITDSDGIDRIYIGIRFVPEVQLQNISDGSGNPTIVFKLEQRVANTLWQLISGSISGSF